MIKKYFTVEEANRLLPVIQVELQLLQETKKKFEEKYALLQQLKKNAKPMTDEEDLFFTIECELEFLQIEARSQIHSFHLKGVQLKDIDMGLIDFPTVLEGEEVLLCWKQGEEHVGHYHSYSEGYTGRKPL